MDAYGFYVQKILPDGRHLGVVPLTFGRARITIGDDDFISDMW
jgi:hypothetical protein